VTVAIIAALALLPGNGWAAIGAVITGVRCMPDDTNRL